MTMILRHATTGYFYELVEIMGVEAQVRLPGSQDMRTFPCEQLQIVEPLEAYAPGMLARIATANMVDTGSAYEVKGIEGNWVVLTQRRGALGLDVIHYWHCQPGGMPIRTLADLPVARPFQLSLF